MLEKSNDISKSKKKKNNFSASVAINVKPMGERSLTPVPLSKRQG